MSKLFAAAHYIIDINANKQGGSEIAHLGVQKLLYYAQGFSLATTGKPMFEEPVEAWACGPVFPDLFHKAHTIWNYGASFARKERLRDLNAEDKELLADVFEAYGQFSEWKLQELTLESPPWKASAASAGRISLDRMREFFETQIDD